MLHGLAFLHRKDNPHGNLRSTNVLFKRSRQGDAVRVMLSESAIPKNYSMSDDSQGLLAREFVLKKFGENKRFKHTNKHCKEADVFAIGVCSYYLWFGLP